MLGHGGFDQGIRFTTSTTERCVGLGFGVRLGGQDLNTDVGGLVFFRSCWLPKHLSIAVHWGWFRVKWWSWDSEIINFKFRLWIFKFTVVMCDFETTSHWNNCVQIEVRKNPTLGLFWCCDEKLTSIVGGCVPWWETCWPIRLMGGQRI